AEHFDVLARVAGVVVIVLGLHFLGVLRFGLLNREARLHPAARPAGFAGAYLVGLAFAFGWTPCVGPVLATILMVAGSTGETWAGISLLGAYAAGIGLPFLAAALAVRPFLGLMARFRRYAAGIGRVLGILLVGTGALFLTGGMADVAFLLLETFPALGRIG
ncbi:MAG TPA: cytochrome c biogenesis protein CcdA, partial [Arenibaculum sp.]|nr:cytochrome c biogenesis protein CcdA [Arenibaculum sp.]